MSAHTHTVAHWPFDEPVNAAAFCTAGVAERRLPVLLRLDCVFEHDPSLAQIADLPGAWTWQP